MGRSVGRAPDPTVSRGADRVIESSNEPSSGNRGGSARVGR
jgi:hypothetical protein